MCAQNATTREPVWQPYEPCAEMPWNLERVVHLHRRAGFAAPWPRLEHDLAAGPRVAIDGLVRPDQAASRTIGDAATASGSAERLKAWWLYRMLLTADPLGERLALMWHNHFATSNRKVQDPVRMREQNELFRKYGRARFGELLAAVLKHPAMLAWLDADSNRQGHPNENLARETMELFTLGIGNYSEQDIKEAARALTGWTIEGNAFALVEARHDAGEKSILGRRGTLSGDDLLRLLLEQPATAKRLAWRICNTLMGEGAIDQSAVAELAESLRAKELDIGWAVETVLRSRLFFSPANMRSRVLGPAEFVVGSLRALELNEPPPSTLLLAEWTARMGQDLFYPPNVGGWNEGRTWLASRMIVARANFAAALAEGRLWHPARQVQIQELARRHGGANDLRQAAVWFAKLFFGNESPANVEEAVAAAEAGASDHSGAHLVALFLARPEYQLA